MSYRLYFSAVEKWREGLASEALRVQWCSTSMVRVVQNVGRIAVASGRCERSGGWLGWAGGREGEGKSSSRGACSIPKGHGMVVMEYGN